PPDDQLSDPDGDAGLALVGMWLAMNALERLANVSKPGPCTCQIHGKSTRLHDCPACELRDRMLDAEGIYFTLQLYASVIDCNIPGGVSDPLGRLEHFLRDHYIALDPQELATTLLRLAGEEEEEADPPLVALATMASG